MPAETQPAVAFDGPTYDPGRDFRRLRTQLERVRYLLVSHPGRRWTLAELVRETGGSEAGVSARLRDLRKPKHGKLDVRKARRSGGLWVYWLHREETR